MARARNINWENLMGAVKRLPDKDLGELMVSAKEKLDAIGVDLSTGRPAKRMGGNKEQGDNYNQRAVYEWIDSAVSLADDSSEEATLTRFHLVNLYATLKARGVKPAASRTLQG